MKTENIYLEAPNYIENFKIKNWSKTIFLAGSISEAADWQTDVANKLMPYFNIFNPRRKDYVWSEREERIQITWEDNYLSLAEIVLFNFRPETLAPITLFELGKMLERSKTTFWKKIYICVHPEYKRKGDVIIQTELTNPPIARNIFDNLDEMIEKIIRENS